MTTAHRPTFDPARGNANTQASGSILHARTLPAHTKLKFRQRGQGGDADKDADDEKIRTNEDLKRKLLEAEQDHMQKIGLGDGNTKGESKEEKRRRILEETKAIDADDSDESDGSSSEEESDEEDENEQLMKELEKIKRERAEEKEKEEEKKRQEEEADREKEIAYSNPLLNPEGFGVKKSWTEDTVFKNQATGADDSKGFVNDMLRSDFHKKFMDKYIK